MDRLLCWKKAAPLGFDCPERFIEGKNGFKYPRMSCPWCQDYSDSEEGDSIAKRRVSRFLCPPPGPKFTPMLTVLPLQLIAYKTALEIGCDVDPPRNLAKSVTVE
ncbi:MAG: hypothetical protein Ct9H90mP16_17480 [Candidatus Poseidoniales archaeon]|nr:MAG: hypothetical protein Ct9H90mP16_17480 [Candidatus Poseidoniales archaeon]